MSFHDLGLPPRWQVERLIVCEPAQCLVVQFYTEEERPRLKRLFARRFDEPTYHELVAHGEGYDICNPTPSPVTPHVYFNRLVWVDWHGEPGGNWDGLYRVDCETGAVECLLSPCVGPSGTRISQIRGISGDGKRLHVVGSSTQPGPKGCTVHYGVAALDLATLTMRPLTPLRAMFV